MKGQSNNAAFQAIKQGNDPYTQPSFSFSNRFARMLWGIVWVVLFRTSPRNFHRWRAFLLRIFGARVGTHSHFYPSVKIWAPWNLEIGNYVGVGDGVNIYCMDKIHINDYAVISQGAHLCGGTHDYNSLNFQLVAKPIVIGIRAWVCAEAFIHPGVTVPEGAVVGARTVVTTSLPEPWAVYVGNPCRQVSIRQRHLAGTVKP